MKGISPQQITIAILVSAILYLMYTKYCTVTESYADYEPLPEEQEIVEPEKEDVPEQPSVAVKPYMKGGDQMDVNKESEPLNLGTCGNGGQFISSNLLPKNDTQLDDSFAEFAPSLDGKNFVDAYKFVFGSQSQSLRNANYQLRSDPLNPQENVCPWMQSTIHPEERRKLDIGAN